MPFNFGLVRTFWAAPPIRTHVQEIEAAVPPGAWPNYVLGNHDEIRIATRFGEDQTRVAAMLLLTLRGTPTLYYGDEIGLEQADIPPEAQQDPWGRNVPGMGRDGCRTPMQWSSGAGAGFTPPAQDPWLPLSADSGTRNVEVQQADPDSLLSLYRHLLAIRRSEPALQVGDYRSLDADPGVLAYLRSDGASRFLVALNFSAVPAGGIDLPDRGRVAVSTELDRDEPVLVSELRLRPYEGVMVGLS
jgi:alpha-glucosidase